MNTWVRELSAHYNAINAVVPLHPIRTASEYDAAIASLNELLDAGATDEKHALADLAATLGELIGDYEAQHHPAAPVAPDAMLRFLMSQHELKQSDLPEIGSQGVVSEILAGKRELNLRQVKALAERFGISPAAFI